MASDRSGRLAVSCCVNSITTVGEGISVEWLLFTVSDDEEISSEWALEPDGKGKPLKKLKRGKMEFVSFDKRRQVG